MYQPFKVNQMSMRGKEVELAVNFDGGGGDADEVKQRQCKRIGFRTKRERVKISRE